MQIPMPSGQVFSVKVLGRTRNSRPAGFLTLAEAEEFARGIAGDGHKVIVYDAGTRMIIRRFGD